MMEDSLAEDRHSPVPGLVHRYPDRVLMLVTTQCASYCRYCTRSRIVGDPTQNFNRTRPRGAARVPAPDAAGPRRPHLRRRRADARARSSSSRSCAACARSRTSRSSASARACRCSCRSASTTSCARCSQKYHPLWINLHFNHPNEITPEVSRAVDKLTKAGLPVGNQSVLLAGVNDCVHIQRALVHQLVANRIRPYYLYQCDLVEGSGHFRTPVGKGLEIMEGLRGHTSGYAVPTYVIDAPGGGGKIPVMPNYLISYSDHKVVLRNYEGYITTYEEPETYQKHDAAACAYCQHERPEPGQSGVLGLLEGERMWIEPKGFDEIHTRGNTEAHRLQDPSKWVPFGVGAIEGQSGAPLPRPRGRRATARGAPDATRDARLRPGRGTATPRGRADRLGPRGAALTARLSKPAAGGCRGPAADGHKGTPPSREAARPARPAAVDRPQVRLRRPRR